MVISNWRASKTLQNHKRVCFPWQYARFCHINALPTAIVLDKWLCTGRTGSTAKKIFPCPTLLASSEPLERLKYLPMPENSRTLEYRTMLQSLGTMIWHWNKLCPGEISQKMAQSIIRIGLGRLHRAKQDTTNWWMRPRRISAPCNVFCCCCCLLVST